MDNSIFLSIGTNCSNRLNNLKVLLRELSVHNVEVVKISSVYETEPYKSNCKKNFYNLIINVKTKHNLFNFFKLTQKIEKKMGRNVKNNPNIERIIDIDILTFKDIIFNSKDLVIPHPKLHERRFVLFPWSEISMEYIVPKYNESIFYLLNNVKDSSKVCKLEYKL